MTGGGAAGGIGAALGCVLGAKLHPGIGAVLQAAGFKEHLEDAALVVTGEGCIDGQSIRFGKAAAGIVKMCGNVPVSPGTLPVAVIAGGMEKDARPLYGMGNVSVMTNVCRPMSVETAIAEADDLLYDAAERAFRFIKMGMGMRR
jgi:glycerate kinase